MAIPYQDKLNSIKAYTTLGINSRKYNAKNPNFTKREKWLISRYYNISKESGYFDYNAKDNEFIPKVKLVKSKKREKGAPRLKGYLMQGANPEDKVRNGKIIKENFEKTFIPMDFSDLPADDESGDYEDAITDTVESALYPFQDELKTGDYFTIVLMNGWELGQNKRKKTPKKQRSDGQSLGNDLDPEENIINCAEKITEQLRAGLKQYKMTAPLVSGVYLWQFKNQRAPNKKEKSAIQGKKKRKKWQKNSGS